MKTLKQLRTDYPLIVEWGRIMGSYPYYVNNQLRKAEELNAPKNTIYFEHETGSPRTTDTMGNLELKKELEALLS